MLRRLDRLVTSDLASVDFIYRRTVAAALVSEAQSYAVNSVHPLCGGIGSGV